MTTWATACDNVPECLGGIDELNCSASLGKLYIILFIIFFVSVYVTGKDEKLLRWTFHPKCSNNVSK